MDLKDKYEFRTYERLRLPVRGKPKWRGDGGRLEISSDSVEESRSDGTEADEFIDHCETPVPPTPLEVDSRARRTSQSNVPVHPGRGLPVSSAYFR
ncbi:hypothetical protein JCM9743_34990 [Natrinema sp. JCM 9743]